MTVSSLHVTVGDLDNTLSSYGLVIYVDDRVGARGPTVRLAEVE